MGKDQHLPHGPAILFPFLSPFSTYSIFLPPNLLSTSLASQASVHHHTLLQITLPDSELSAYTPELLK